MTKSKSRSLTRRIADLDPASESRPAKAKRERRPRSPKVKKLGPIAAFLRPLGIGVALLLCAYGLASLGSTFWRSYQRHQDYTTAAHKDQSVFDVIIGRSSLPEDAIDLVVRDFDGKLRRVAAAKSETDKFVNDIMAAVHETGSQQQILGRVTADRHFREQDQIGPCLAR